MDKVMIYPFNVSKPAPVDTTKGSFAASEAGSGPRHFEFHPNGKYAYLIEELTGTIAVYKHNAGKLVFLQRISSHPQDYKGAFGSADIHVSPDGKFLYASNRGDANNIAIFSIAADGKLTTKGFQSTLGKKPRNFVIDPMGNYLLVANQDTNNIVVFKRDKKTGLLSETGHQIEVPNPVCLKMVK
jgi:6-phosphogluconolactonase